MKAGNTDTEKTSLTGEDAIVGINSLPTSPHSHFSLACSEAA